MLTLPVTSPFSLPEGVTVWTLYAMSSYHLRARKSCPPPTFFSGGATAGGNVESREEPGSKDGGVFLLLHLASFLAGTNITGDQDCSCVPVLLASKLAPPSAGSELNFFKKGST